MNYTIIKDSRKRSPEDIERISKLLLELSRLEKLEVTN